MSSSSLSEGTGVSRDHRLRVGLSWLPSRPPDLSGPGMSPLIIHTAGDSGQVPSSGASSAASSTKCGHLCQLPRRLWRWNGKMCMVVPATLWSRVRLLEMWLSLSLFYCFYGSDEFCHCLSMPLHSLITRKGWGQTKDLFANTSDEDDDDDGNHEDDGHLLDSSAHTAGKELACNVGELSLIPGSRSSPGDGIGYPLQNSWASLVVQIVKNPPAMWETWVGKLPWRRAWQHTPVFLPGESPWTEEPGGLQSMGSQRVRHD